MPARKRSVPFLFGCPLPTAPGTLMSQDRTWGFGVPLGFRLPPSPPPRRPRHLPTPASFTPSHPPPPVAVPCAARQEAGGTSPSTREARPRLLVSPVGPVGVSAGGTECLGVRSQCPRPGSAGFRRPVTARKEARVTATRSTSASARVPWAARIRETHAPRGAPHRGPRAPATRLWRPLADTWGAPRRDVRGAANCQKIRCAKLGTWELKAQCRANLIGRGGGGLFARTEMICGVKLEPPGAC